MGTSPVVFFHCLIFPHSHSLSSLHPLRVLCAGQGLTSVKTKAGEALRLHRTSVGEEAREEEEGTEERREGGSESGDTDLPNSGESSVSPAASGRGVFSTITHAVQNTVSQHKHTHMHTLSTLVSTNSKLKLGLSDSSSYDLSVLIFLSILIPSSVPLNVPWLL